MIRAIEEALEEWNDGNLGLAPDERAIVARLATGAALGFLTESIIIERCHQEACSGGWTHAADGSLALGVDALLVCNVSGCPAEARIPEALLVSLVLARSPNP